MRRGEARRLASTTTDATGSFALTGIGSGRVALWAEAPTRGAVLLENIEPVTQDVVLQLSEGLMFEGRVVIDATTPAAGAWVRLVHSGHSRFFEAITDASGNFRVGPVPMATYALVAGRADALPAHDLLYRGQRNVVLQLWSPRTVEGVVEADGAPVAGARVECGGAVWSPDGYATVGAHPVCNGGREVVTGADGRFTLGGLVPGLYDVSASDGDRFARAKTEVPKQGKPPAVRLAIEAVAVLTGHLRSLGRSVAGAELKIGRFLKDNSSARSGGDGTYRLLTPVGKEQILSLEAKGYASQTMTLDLERGTRVLDFELVPEASIDGVLVDADTKEPVKRAIVEASSLAGVLSGVATTDDAGRFSFSGLAPNAYRLHTDCEGIVSSREVVPPTTDIRLERGCGLSVSGGIVDAAGKSLLGKVHATNEAEHRMHHPPHREVWSDAAGAFTVRGLYPGTWELTVDGSTGFGRLEVTLPATAPVRLQVAAPQTISGTVVDERGQPVPGSRVFGHTVVGFYQVTAKEKTGSDGLFTLSANYPGEYELHADVPGQRTDYKSPTRTKGGATGIRVIAVSAR